MNLVSISGNLGADPTFKRGDRSDWCAFRVAVGHPFKKDETTWLSCMAFGKTAEFVDEWFKKGDRIEVVGHLVEDEYENRDGDKVKGLKVMVDRVSFGGGGRKDKDDRRDDRDDRRSGGGSRDRDDRRRGDDDDDRRSARDRDDRGRDDDRSRGRGRGDDDRRRDDRGRGRDDRSRGGGRNDIDDEIPF